MVYAILLILFTNSSLGQQSRQCPGNTSCKFLRECPSINRLLFTRKYEDLIKVQKARCGFIGYNSLVCCEKKSLLPKNCGKPLVTEDKIFGGSPARIGAYPWMAAIGNVENGLRGRRLKFICGGSLISNRYVLTAAHCLVRSDLTPRRISIIHLGDWNLAKERDCQTTSDGETCSPPHMVAGVEDIIVHPEYNTRAKDSDDIALIRLNISIHFDSKNYHIMPICLPKMNQDVRTISQSLPVATGWGITKEREQSDILLKVKLEFASQDSCRELFPFQFVSKQLCVGGNGIRDTCMGDSGGPLALSMPAGRPFYQIGIVSYGFDPCGINRAPAVYTSVSDYVDWIKDNLKQ